MYFFDTLLEIALLVLLEEIIAYLFPSSHVLLCPVREIVVSLFSKAEFALNERLRDKLPN